MQVKLVHCTPDAEKIVAYCARVSSNNQENPEYVKLIKYLIKNKHWSPLEMASMCVEIETTRGVAPQILRHRSFSFQEFSLRYAAATEYENYSARSQDTKNRQASHDDMAAEDKDWFTYAQDKINLLSDSLYKEALGRGIAKECARNLLPMSTKTKLYMMGSLRSWVHYIDLRTDEATQKEHRDIALECKRIFTEQFPIIAEACGYGGL
jgi:thymidylate synthase (FAD)